MEFPSRAEFYGWLAEHRPDDIVGESRNMGCCPIATYLNEHGANGNAYVRPDRIPRLSCWRVTEDGSDRHSLPGWANKFAVLVDREIDVVVTASSALGIFSRV